MEQGGGGRPLVEVRNLSVGFSASMGFFKKRTVSAIDDLSLAAWEGESLGVVGESGSGKTTLARVLVKLLRPHSGEVLFKGEDVLTQTRKEERVYRRKVQMVFQDPYESLNPRSTVWDAVEEPLLIHHVAGDRHSRGEMVERLVAMVGLDPGAVKHKYPHQLSGGERQRVSIARALAVSPDLLIADEPVSMLDVSMRIGILDLMLELKRKLGLTLIFITHDLGVARYFCDRIAVMYQGKLMEVARTEELLERPLHPYTKLLLDSVPVPGGAGPAPPEAVDADPRPAPAGCRFSPRCPYARDRCRGSAPDLTEVSRSRYAACYYPLTS